MKNLVIVACAAFLIAGVAALNVNFASSQDYNKSSAIVQLNAEALSSETGCTTCCKCEECSCSGSKTCKVTNNGGNCASGSLVNCREYDGNC
jgi:hypothetical protein